MALPTEKSKKEPDYLKKTYLLYGEPKIGKSTTAAAFGGEKTSVLFFPTEPGLKFQEVYQYSVEETIDGELIKRPPYKWEQFRECVAEVTKQNFFKCLVIDTVDNLFSWCEQYVLKELKINHPSDLKWGKGYSEVKKEFSRPINYLAQIGYGVIFLSHSKTTDDEKTGTSKIETKLSKQAKDVVEPLCDYIFYMYSDPKGQRLIRTKGVEGIKAGDRSGKLPEIMPLDAQILIKHLKGEVDNVANVVVR